MTDLAFNIAFEYDIAAKTHREYFALAYEATSPIKIRRKEFQEPYSILLCFKKMGEEELKLKELRYKLSNKYPGINDILKEYQSSLMDFDVFYGKIYKILKEANVKE